MALSESALSELLEALRAGGADAVQPYQRAAAGEYQRLQVLVRGLDLLVGACAAIACPPASAKPYRRPTCRAMRTSRRWIGGVWSATMRRAGAHAGRESVLPNDTST
jgi:hypothetical protein